MKPHLKPIKRSSASQPQLGAEGRRSINEDWYGRTPVSEEPRHEYNAETDPYCPYTRSETYLKHRKQRQQLDEETRLLSKSMSIPRQITELQPQLKPMERPISAPDEHKFPKHQVASTTFGDTGLTFSAEPYGNPAEGLAELEVLKAILNREGYLSRLANSARSISRKFKPEVADILDLVRAASLDVVEAVVRWRDAKVD
jgi:hypothetical protein